MTVLSRRPTRPLLSRLWPSPDRAVLPDLPRLFGDFFLEPFSLLPGVPWAVGETTLAPRVDVYQTDGEVVLKAELPGVAKEDIEVAAEDSAHLRIKGHRKREEEVRDENVYRCERVYGECERLVHLPSEIDEQHITARHENGVLEIRAPKKEPEPKSVKVEIQ